MLNSKFDFLYSQKTSRAGWHSPQDNDLSSKPKSDDYPYRHTVRSTSSPKRMLHKSSYTLEKNNSCNSSNHLHPNYQQYSKSVDHNQFSQTFDQHIHHHSNDSCDSRQSNIHHIRQNNYSRQTLTASKYPTSSSSTTSNELKPTQYERISLMDQSNQIMSNNTAGKQTMEKQFSTKNLSERGGNGADTMSKINKFEQDKIPSVRKRDEYQPDTISDGKIYSKQINENSENLYGKIQSRTLSTSANSGETYTPSSICGGNYDRCNANHFNGGMKRCDISKGVVMNCVNNNNYDSGQQLHHFNHHNGNNNILSDNLQRQQSLLNDGYGGKSKVNIGQPINSTMHSNIRRPSGEKNRNMLRTNRYSNGSHLSAPGTHQLAHMINSLSSPESAYSTGYSTDGTSPGKNISRFYYVSHSHFHKSRYTIGNNFKLF